MRRRAFLFGLLLMSAAVGAETATHDHHHADAMVTEEPVVVSAIDTESAAAHAHMQPSPFVWAELDQLEWRASDGDEALGWDGAISWGGAFDRVELRTEGERASGETTEQETRLFWSHAVARWWESTLGLRQDEGHGPTRRWLAVGVQGLAPYWFELAATAFVGDSGRTALRLEGEYELLLRNQLILQPALEIDFYGQDDEVNGRGRGLSESVLGLRLRYEIQHEFAPYLGLRWQRRYGDSADLARAAGERVGEAQVVAGVRLWF